MDIKTLNRKSLPSEDRAWMKYYPEQMIKHLSDPEQTVTEYLLDHIPSMDATAIHYYGTDISWKRVFENVDRTARSLRVLGIKEGDNIPVFFKLVPEFVYLMLAAEKIGASILCRDNTIEENALAVKQSGAKYIFTHDFISADDFDIYRKEGDVRMAITLSPYESAVFSAIPEYIQDSINGLYGKESIGGPRTLDWGQFMAMGELYDGEVEAARDVYRPLLKCYTSGSTGPSKQVIHCAHSLIGNLHQMSFYGDTGSFRPTWLTTALPPSLVAVVVAMMLLPLASNKLLIMDPFVDPMDVDLELMRYQPNCWPSIPMFFEILIKQGRIPEDYDMSHLYSTGVGCEAYNNTQFKRAQRFLDKHNANAHLTAGYGSSEAGSNITLPVDNLPQGNGKVGIPMPLSTMGIFKPGTIQELGYGEVGEICVQSPGVMLGYDDDKATARTLRKHTDEKIWLHTGDIGYVNENGIFYTTTRGSAPRYGYPEQELATLPMENRLADAGIEGIEDQFFVIAPDPEHKHHFLPYLYVILEEGFQIRHVQKQIYDALDEYMYPVEINVLPERPFWHYKTNRIGLTKELYKNNFEG